MIKNISRIEAKIGEKYYQLTCDQDSPIEGVKEALFQLLKFVGQIEDAIKHAQENNVEKKLPTTPEQPV
jgi:hypothetical protein